MMTIRKLLLPTLIAAALAVPVANAQSADTGGKGKPRDQAAASKADAGKSDAKADARKDGKQDDKSQAPKKDAKPRAEEQPDEPEEDGR
jgi:hypothetical protein